MNQCDCQVVPNLEYERDTDDPIIIHCPLHAAAPELLAALEAMLHAYGINGLGSDRVKAHEMTRAAIAKAKGDK